MRGIECVGRAELGGPVLRRAWPCATGAGPALPNLNLYSPTGQRLLIKKCRNSRADEGVRPTRTHPTNFTGLMTPSDVAVITRPMHRITPAENIGIRRNAGCERVFSLSGRKCLA
jgi:hypothetical protein